MWWQEALLDRLVGPHLVEDLDELVVPLLGAGHGVDVVPLDRRGQQRGVRGPVHHDVLGLLHLVEGVELRVRDAVVAAARALAAAQPAGHVGVAVLVAVAQRVTRASGDGVGDVGVPVAVVHDHADADAAVVRRDQRVRDGVAAEVPRRDPDLVTLLHAVDGADQLVVDLGPRGVAAVGVVERRALGGVVGVGRGLGRARRRPRGSEADEGQDEGEAQRPAHRSGHLRDPSKCRVGRSGMREEAHTGRRECNPPTPRATCVPRRLDRPVRLRRPPSCAGTRGPSPRGCRTG